MEKLFLMMSHAAGGEVWPREQYGKCVAKSEGLYLHQNQNQEGMSP